MQVQLLPCTKQNALAVGRTTGGTFCRDKITVNGEKRTEHAERSDVTPDG